MPFFLLHQKFIETAERFPHKIALQIRSSDAKYKRYTYAEALTMSRALGFYFISQGVKRQDRIALILENGPEWPIFYFGILFAAATAVPIDVQLTQQEIQNILSDAEARLVIDRSNADEVLKRLKDAPHDFEFPGLDVEEPASIIYTSGTTAVPKGVVLTHRNFSANFGSIDRLGLCNKNDNMISLLPLHHSYPFMVTLLVPLFLGGTVTYVKTLKPEEILSAMRETGVTVLVGVPQLFYLFHKGIFEKVKTIPAALRFLLSPFIARKVRRTFGAKLRFFASGGARLDPKIAGDLSKLGFTILEGYGLTETSPVVTFNPLRRQKFGSVGIAIPAVEVKILSPDSGGRGEVLIKGPNVMKGYYRRQAETDEVIKEEWFHSGDLGYIDEDGYLFLTGRTKEVIVLSSGKNIYPEEVEAHYKKSPFIKEVCVMGTLKEGLSEELGAVIVPEIEYFKKTGEVNIAEKLKWNLENFSKQLSPYKRIMDFVIAKEGLPKTRLGKLKRYEVGKIYSGQFGEKGRTAHRSQPTVEDLEILNSEVGKKAVEFIRVSRGIKEDIRPDDHLELDLGIDSLGRVELAVGLEKLFNIDIPDEEMAQVFTMKDVVLGISGLTLGKTQKLPNREGIVSDELMWRAILRQDPKERIKAKMDLHPSLFSNIITYLVAKFLSVVFKVIFRLRVRGGAGIPKEGPFILCPNHSSYLDAFIVAASAPFYCKVNLFFLGFREYFIQPIIKNLIRWMRVIPIDPAVELVNAMQASSFIIRNKGALCIFPEGQRSIDGEVKEFKKGIGILAKELNVTLVPVYIEGAFNAWPRGERFPKMAPLKIVFGEPFGAAELMRLGKAKGAKDDYEAIAAGLREKVLGLRV